MKINIGTEPIVYTSKDIIANIINELQTSIDLETFFQVTKKWSQVKYQKMTQLSDWVLILNRFDEILLNILNQSRKYLIVCDENLPLPNDYDLQQDIDRITIILQFSINLLNQAFGKEIYNSVEILIELLGSFDDNLVTLSLQCLSELSVPPSSHRCSYFLSRHLTKLHANLSYYGAIFDIIESYYNRVPVKLFLSNTFEVTSDMLSLNINASTPSYIKNSKFSKDDASDQTKNTMEALAKSDESLFISNVHQDSRGIHDIIIQHGNKLSYEMKYAATWRLRFKRYLQSLSGRVQIITDLYRATVIILGCHPNSETLYNYFYDKMDLLKDQVELIGSGPGTNEFDANDNISLEIRCLASLAIASAIETKDVQSPIFAQCPWLLHDLGCNRGQYMGLMPSLLRTSSSFIATLGINKDGSEYSEFSQDEKDRLLWIEHIFILTSVLVDANSTLPALIDSGLISSILTIASVKRKLSRTPEMIYVETLALEVLEIAIAHQSNAIALMKQNLGHEILLTRLFNELQCYLQHYQENDYMQISNDEIIIQVIIDTLFSFVQETKNDPDREVAQLYRNPLFYDTINYLFINIQDISSVILTTALMLLTEVINRDSAPPTVLLFFLNNDIISNALRLIDLQVTIIKNEYAASMINFIMAISISDKGRELVVEHKVIERIFSMFHDKRYYLPSSRLLMSEYSTSIGKGLGEIMNYYDIYNSVCLQSLMNEMNLLCTMGEKYLTDPHVWETTPSLNSFSSSSCNSSGASTNSVHLNEEYLSILYSSVALLNCMDRMFTKATHVKYFLENNGFDLLLRFRHLSIGPPRFYFVTLSCIVDSTMNSIGYAPLKNKLMKVSKFIASNNPTGLLPNIMDKMELLTNNLQLYVSDYWQYVESHPDFSEKFGQELKSIKKNGLYGLLASLSRETLQTLCLTNTLNEQLTQYFQIVRTFAFFEYLMDCFGSIIYYNFNVSTFNLYTEFHNTPNIYPRLQKFLDQVYLPTVQEIARARSIYFNPSKSGKVPVQPIYELLVISEVLMVKETVDDNSKKVARIPKGTILYADERISFSGNIKYSLKDKSGWINLYRSNSTEPQFLVVDIQEKSPEVLEAETKRLTALFTNSYTKSDYENLSVVSARRGGYISFYKFHSIIKTKFFGIIPKLFNSINENSLSDMLHPFQRPNSNQADSKTQNEIMKALDPILFSVIARLSTVELPADYQSIADAISHSSLSNENTLPASYHTNVFQHEPLFTFQKHSTNNISDFNIEQTVMFITLSEIIQIMLFDPRSQKPQCRILLLLRLFYSQEQLLDKFFYTSAKFFLSALDFYTIDQVPLKSVPLTDISPVHALVANKYRDIFEDFSDKDLQKIKFPLELMQLNNDMQEDELREELKQICEQNNILRSRRILTLSNVSIVIELWKSLATSLGSSTSPAEKQLFTLVSENVSFQATCAYNPYVFKRFCLLTMLRHIYPLWNNDFLPNLTLPILKSFMEALSNILKSLQTLASKASNAPPTSSRSRNFRFTERIMDEIAGHGIGSGARRVPIPFPHLQQQQPRPPQVDPQTMSQLIEMGFSRGQILRAVEMTGIDDIAVLVPYLLETPYYEYEEPAPAPAPVPAPAPPEVPPILNDFLDNIPSGSTNEIPPIPPANELPKVELSPYLPIIPAYQPSQKDADKEFTKRILVSLSYTIAKSFKSLISMGQNHWIDNYDYEINGNHYLPELDEKTANNIANNTPDHSRVSYILSVFNSLLPMHYIFYSGDNREGKIRLNQMDWIYQALIDTLSKYGTQLHSYALHYQLEGLLLSLVILLSTKISKSSSSSSSDPNPLSIGTLIILLQKNLPYIEAHRQLIQIINQLPLEKSTVPLMVNIQEDCAWFSSAFLLFDYLNQSFSINRSELRSVFQKMQNKDNENQLISSLIQTNFYTQLNQTSQLSTNISKENITDENKTLFNPMLETTFTLEDKIALCKISMKLLKYINTVQHQQAKEGFPATPMSQVSFLRKQIQTPETSPIMLWKVQLTRAILQLLVHLHQNDTLLQILQDEKMISVVMDIDLNIEGLSSIVFTLIQRQYEDDYYLKQSMKAAIKVVYERILKQEGKVLITNFVEIICPLIYRNQFCFLDAFFSKFRLKLSYGRQIIEPLEASKQTSQTTSDIPPPPGDDLSPPVFASSPIIDPNSLHSSKKQRLSSSQAQTTKFDEPLPSLTATPQELRRKSINPTSSSEPPVIKSTSSPGAVLSVNQSRNIRAKITSDTMDNIIGFLVSKWKTLNKIIALPVNSDLAEINSIINEDPKSSTFLSISDILFLLADLIAAIPSFSMAFQRYQIPLSEIIPNGQNSISIFTFLMQHVLLNRFIIKVNQYSNKSSAQTSKAILRLLGSNSSDATSYVFASMISRPGDSRNRGIQELFEIISNQFKTFDDSSQYASLIIFSEFIHSILNPPSHWLKRDSFVLPVKDIVFVLFTAKFHFLLEDLLTKIDISHPLAQQSMSALSIPLDILFRRYQHVNKELIGLANPNALQIENADQSLGESITRERVGTESSMEVIESDNYDMNAQDRQSSQHTQPNMMTQQNLYNQDHLLAPVDQSILQINDPSSDEGEEFVDDDEESELEHDEDDEDHNMGEEEDDDDMEEMEMEGVDEDDVHDEEEDEEGHHDHDHEHEFDHFEEDDEDNEDDESHETHDMNITRDSEALHAEHHDEDDENDEDEDFLELDDDDDDDNGDDHHDHDHQHHDNNFDLLFNGNNEVANDDEEEDDDDDDMDGDEDDEDVVAINEDEEIHDEEVENPQEDEEDERHYEQMMMMGASSHDDRVHGSAFRDNGSENSSTGEQEPTGNNPRSEFGIIRIGANTGNSGAPNIVLMGRQQHNARGDSSRRHHPRHQQIVLNGDISLNFQNLPNGASIRFSTSNPGGLNIQDIFSSMLQAHEARVGEDEVREEDEGADELNTPPPPVRSFSSFAMRNRTMASVINQPPPHSILSQIVAPHRMRSLDNDWLLMESPTPFGPTHYYELDGQSKNTRNALTPLRRTLGPLISNRRWGVDVGELEPAGQRMSVLTANIEQYYTTFIDKPESNNNTTSSNKQTASYKMKNFFRHPMFGFPDESKEEGELQESKDNDDSAPDPFSMLFGSSLGSRNYTSNNINNEGNANGNNPEEINGFLRQFFDHITRGPNSANTNTNTDSNTNVNASLQTRRTRNNNHIRTYTSNNNSFPSDIVPPSNAGPLSAPAPTRSSAATTNNNNTSQSTIPTGINPNLIQENVDFINSLLGELRQEALIEAEADFLHSLSYEMQAEARDFRIAAGLRPLPFSANTRQETAVPATPLAPVTPSVPNAPPTSSPQPVTDNTMALSRVSSTPALPSANTVAPEVKPTPHPTVTMKDQLNKHCFITLSGNLDRDAIVPFQASLIVHLLNWLIIYPREKVPSILIKTLVTCCKYDLTRKPILHALFAIMNKDVSEVERQLVVLYQLIGKDKTNAQECSSFNSLLNNIKLSIQTVHEKDSYNTIHYRKFIATIMYLFKKSEYLVWYDIMKQPSPMDKDYHPLDKWLFGQLFNLLPQMMDISHVFVEILLHVIERICLPLSKVSPDQVNKLIEYRLALAQEHANASTSSNGPPVPVHSTTIAQQSSPNPQDEDRPQSKRMRLSHEPTIFESNKEKETSQITEKDKDPKKQNVLLPFPILSNSDAKTLSKVVGHIDCSSTARKALMRIMRYLSLYDGNWRSLLNELAITGSDIIFKTSNQFQELLDLLSASLQEDDDMHTVINKIESSKPKILYEARFLNILKLMTVLRARSSSAAIVEKEVVSEYMRKMRNGALWDVLNDSLEIIRELELRQETKKNPSGERENQSTSVSSSGPNKKKSPFLETDTSKSSFLATRFIPLVECFFLMVSRTMVGNPTSLHTTLLSGSSHLPQQLLLAPPHASISQDVPAPHSSESLELVRTNSTILPGYRFRQSSAFLSMHLEITDENSSKYLLAFLEKNHALINSLLKNNNYLLENSFSILITVPKCRTFLDFSIKRAYFKSKLKLLRSKSLRSPDMNFNSSLTLTVHRERVLEDSFIYFRYKSPQELMRKLKITFSNEQGIDAGGLTREYYSLLSREIFNPNYALFTSVGSNNVIYQPNPHSNFNNDHLAYFKFIGQIIAKAITDGYLLDVHFTRSFYKHILGQMVTLQDLEAIEPDMYKSLNQILETPLEYLGLELKFTAEVNEFGNRNEVDLIPDGKNINVTDENKQHYIHMLAQHRMTSAIKEQTSAFLEGFHDLIPAELISIFDAQELELLISGLPDIDIDDLRGHTNYHTYKSTDPIINQFWNILKSFTQEEKALFLQFVTGTSKVPLEGFKALQGSQGVELFNIHRVEYKDNLLPSSHTCFNQLDLPAYPSEELMREKLLLAIKEGSEGFGFA